MAINLLQALNPQLVHLTEQVDARARIARGHLPKHRAAVGERGIHAVAFDAGAEAMRRLYDQHIKERAAKPHGFGAQLLAEHIAVARAAEHVGVVARGDEMLSVPCSAAQSSYSATMGRINSGMPPPVRAGVLR